MYSTEGVVLKKIDAGEADGVFIMYTRDFGKIRALAAGVKKSEAKLKGHLEVFSHVAVQFVLGKYGERLTHAVAVSSWPEIRTDMQKAALAYYVVTLIDAHCLPGQKDEELWQFLLQTFNMIKNGTYAERGVEAFLHDKELELLKLLGYEGQKSLSILDVHIARPWMIGYNGTSQ